MSRRSKKMCKYANTGVVKVSTQKQVQIISRMLNSRNQSQQTPVKTSVSKTQFNANLWGTSKK